MTPHPALKYVSQTLQQGIYFQLHFVVIERSTKRFKLLF